MPLIYWPHCIMAASLPLLLYSEVIRACWRRSWGKRRQGSIINAKVYVGPTTYPHLKRQMKGQRRNKENGVIRATCNSLGFPLPSDDAWARTVCTNKPTHYKTWIPYAWQEGRGLRGVERGDRSRKRWQEEQIYSLLFETEQQLSPTETLSPKYVLNPACSWD